MPPKKAGKKKKAGDDDGGAMTDAQIAKALEMQNAALKRQLAERTTDFSVAAKEKREVLERMDDLKKDFESEKETTFDITADMTRQYKAMQEELLGKINVLQNTINSLKDDLAESRVTLEDVRRNHERQLKEKDDVIEAMKLKMNDMAEEFAEMLQETLKRMGEKIEITSSKWEGDDSVPIARRMEDLSISSKA